MTKIEFSDVYRFLASVGLVLISLAGLLPWLFLREPFDVTITAAELQQLTPAAQSIIASRQLAALWFLRNIAPLSVFLFVAGVVLLITGTSLWAKRQRLVDQRENLETEKLRRELENMTPQQIVEKVYQEISDEPSSQVLTPQPIRDYLRIEEAVVNKLYNCFGKQKVLTNRRIDNLAYDAILLSERRDTRDVLIDIKASTSVYISEKVLAAAHELHIRIAAYYRATQHSADGVLLLILPPDERWQQLRVDRYFLAVDNHPASDVRAIALTEREFEELTCTDLGRLLFFFKSR